MWVIVIGALVTSFVSLANAHPLGNFTVNHFARLEVTSESIRVRYVVDLAEIPAFQESQTADLDRDGQLSNDERDSYFERVTPAYLDGLRLSVDGTRVPLQITGRSISQPSGSGGLRTLRLEYDFVGQLPAGGGLRKLGFEDANQPDRIGWREIVVAGTAGITVFDSTAFGTSSTDELRNYPQDPLAAPLAERRVELSWTSGALPDGAAALRARDGQVLVPRRSDSFAELINVTHLTPAVVLLGILLAMGFGALHAFSPGHGKAVVGAYLVGSRGTPRHAMFLGVTVTITHTLGVFALGLVTLFAADYILPERLLPWISLASGATILVLGTTLLIRRFRSARGASGARAHIHAMHSHDGDHFHDHHHGHPEHDAAAHTHTHGGSTHTHLPPGADSTTVTWRSLLALGVSGGLLPCPSALVLMLSAITLHRVGYGLILVLAFSAGLAATLTGVGLIFIYGKRLLARPFASGRLARWLPVGSALVIAVLGAIVCYQALGQAGVDLRAGIASLWPVAMPPASAGAISTASILILGFVLGLKHAVEADHLAAVTTIVSERKSVLSSSLVGGLWGIGHTISLLVAGVVVILLQVRIGERTALALEFCVALMLIGLGLNAIRKLWRGGRVHLHAHQHFGRPHAHVHLHGEGSELAQHTHHGLSFGGRSLAIGLVHGMAGSAALMLLVLSTISSPLKGMLYIGVFGAGSIGGMMLMSALVGIPIHFTANRFGRLNAMLRGLAGAFSLCFGLLMAYQIGFVDGLFH
jgi:ABC-type nickel/cobalt efflux system permease component RcnA